DVVAPPLENESQRLELSAESPLPRVEGLELRPVRDVPDGVLRAGLGAVGRSAVRDPAAPVLDAVDAARHDLDEIDVPPALEREHGVGQATRGVVDFGHMAPEGHG